MNWRSMICPRCGRVHCKNQTTLIPSALSPHNVDVLKGSMQSKYNGNQRAQKRCMPRAVMNSLRTVPTFWEQTTVRGCTAGYLFCLFCSGRRGNMNGKHRSVFKKSPQSRVPYHFQYSRKWWTDTVCDTNIINPYIMDI